MEKNQNNETKPNVVEAKRVLKRSLTDTERKELDSRKEGPFKQREGWDPLDEINKFIASNQPDVDIEIEGVLMDTLYSGFKDTIKRQKIQNVKCVGFHRRVVLKRTDVPQTSS